MTGLRFWLLIARLGLVQAAIGATVVFATSTLNRVMVVEFGLPALLPGALVGFHYAVQMTRPRWGHGADRGGRRTPWIVGGMAALAAGAVLAAVATVGMGGLGLAGLALAVLAYGLIGVGVGAAGTSLLVLLAQVAGAERRAAAAALVWMMMIAGFVVTAAVAGTLLAPFSPQRLVETAAVIAGGALLVACAAVAGVEPARPLDRTAAGASDGGFSNALREVWAEPAARLFTMFVFFSMVAYSAQELVLEPFAGTVFGLAPADSARLAGLQHGGLLVGMIAFAVLGSVTPRLRSTRSWTAVGCGASGVAALAVATIGMAGQAVLLHGAVLALGVANGLFSMSAVAGMMQLAGQGRPGREGVRMGLWGAAQAVAFACGGVFGTGTVDLTRRALHAPTMAYAAVFVAEAVLFAAAAALALRALPAEAASPPVPRDMSLAGRRRWAQ